MVPGVKASTRSGPLPRPAQLQPTPTLAAVRPTSGVRPEANDTLVRRGCLNMLTLSPMSFNTFYTTEQVGGLLKDHPAPNISVERHILRRSQPTR